MLRRSLANIFLIAVLVLAGASLHLLLRAPRFETNILALLPSISPDKGVEEALSAHSLAVSSKVVVLVRGATPEGVETAVGLLAQGMRASGLFAEVRDRASLESLRALEQQFRTHSFQLTAPPATGDESADAQALLDEARANAFAPQGIQWLQGVGEDPLLRLPTYLQSIQRSEGGYALQNGYVYLADSTQPTILVTATLATSGLHDGTRRRVTSFFEEFKRPHGVEIVPGGIVFFSEEAASRTEREVSTITGVTMLLVTAVLWWVFRTPRMVLITSLALGLSFLVTLVLSQWIWLAWAGTPLHLITIGFGSSLIGVSSDYALHYFVAHRLTRADTTHSPLSRVRSGLILGFVTTVIGFLGIAVSPFPGLQQLALFSICGLFISLLIVFLWLPRLSGQPLYDRRLEGLVRATGSLSSRRLYLMLGIMSIAVCVVGLPRLTVRDDIRVLSTPSPELLARQGEVAKSTGFHEGATFALVYAADDEELLQREERARTRLDALVTEGQLESYRTLSQVVPSRAKQNDWYQRTRAVLSRNQVAVTQYVEELHLPAASRQRLASLAALTPADYVTAHGCFSAGACDPVRDLYLGRAGAGVASVIMMRGLKVSAASVFSGIQGVVPINQADTISAALKRYREVAMGYTAAVYVVVVLVLVWRYGARHAFWTLVPPTLGGATSLAVLALCGVPINVFSVFALLVLIGLSIDYAIFCAEDTLDAAGTNFAVLLSAVTTAISFGLLSLSSTPALRSFGIVLSIGVLVAALVAPLAARSTVTSLQRRERRSILVLLLLFTAGCSLSLPAPEVSQVRVSDATLFARLCRDVTRRGQVLLSGNEPRTAALECSAKSAVVVVLNSFGLRTQTVVLHADGALRSEVVFLASDVIEPEQLLRKFAEH